MAVCYESFGVYLEFNAKGGLNFFECNIVSNDFERKVS